MGSRDLSGCVLHSCDLSGATFKGTNLYRAKLRGSDLSFADLETSKNLTVEALGLANLQHAKLPPKLRLDEAVASAVGRSAAVQKTAFSVFGLYAYLTVAAISSVDSGLFVPTTTTKLPIVQLDVPTRQFFILAMAIVAASHAYLMSEISSLTTTLNRLPAFLPDGRRIDRALGAWVLFSAEGAICRRSGLASFRRVERDLEWKRWGRLVWRTFRRRGVRAAWRRANRMRNALQKDEALRARTARERRAGRRAFRMVAWAVVWSIFGLFAFLTYGYLMLKLYRLHPPFWDWKTWLAPIGLAAIAASGAYVGHAFQHRSALSPRPAPLLAVFAFAIPLSAALLFAYDAGTSPFYPDGSKRWTLVYGRLSSLFNPAANMSRRDLSERPANLALESPDDWAKVKPFPLDGANVAGVIADSTFLARVDGQESTFDGGTFLRGDLRRARFNKASFVRASFTRADVREADFVGANLRGARFEETRLEGADFEHARLGEATFDTAFADRAKYVPPEASRRSSLLALTETGWPKWIRTPLDHPASFAWADLSKARILDGSKFRGAILRHANLDQAVVRESSLNDADLNLTRLTDSRWSMVEADRARFLGTELGGARFVGCQMQDAQFKDARSEGGVRFVQCDLRRTHWEGALLDLPRTIDRPRELRTTFAQCNLAGATAIGVLLRGVLLLGCELREASWVGADLSGATIQRCEVDREPFKGAVLRKTVWRDVDLIGKTFKAVDLREGKIQRCRIGETTFVGADMRKTRWLDVNLVGKHIPSKVEGAMFVRCRMSAKTVEGLRGKGADVVSPLIVKERGA